MGLEIVNCLSCSYKSILTRLFTILVSFPFLQTWGAIDINDSVVFIAYFANCGFSNAVCLMDIMGTVRVADGGEKGAQKIDANGSRGRWRFTAGTAGWFLSVPKARELPPKPLPKANYSHLEQSVAEPGKWQDAGISQVGKKYKNEWQ